MKRSTRILSYFLIFAIVFSFGWESASYYITKKSAAHELNQPEENSPMGTISTLLGTTKEQADLTLFWKIWKELYDMYVDETKLDKQAMVYGAIRGMVSSLNDPYTVFMTPDETKDFNASLNGTLEGIGAELTVKDHLLIVVSPIKDSPAEKAGLLPGDVVYKIDGNITSEMTLFDAIKKIRGVKGTKVTLTILRKDNEKPMDIAITRDDVSIASVTMEDKGGGIYDIAINEFSDNTKAEFDEIIQKIILKEPKGIIIDLRYNGGGYLDVSVELLSEFIKGKKEAVIIKKRSGQASETLYVSGNAPLADIPLVVLVNKGSASASEIFAGAIHDHKRGLILGEQTFGKGSVQEVDKMPDGSSLRITIAKWYTPSGKSISDVGITPDQIVPLTDEDAQNKKDPQMDAGLKYLKNL